MQWLKIKLVLLKYRRTPSVIYLSESFYVQGNNEQAQLLTAAFQVETTLRKNCSLQPFISGLTARISHHTPNNKNSWYSFQIWNCIFLAEKWNNKFNKFCKDTKNRHYVLKIKFNNKCKFLKHHCEEHKVSYGVKMIWNLGAVIIYHLAVRGFWLCHNKIR